MLQLLTLKVNSTPEMSWNYVGFTLFRNVHQKCNLNAETNGWKLDIANGPHMSDFVLTIYNQIHMHDNQVKLLDINDNTAKKQKTHHISHNTSKA